MQHVQASAISSDFCQFMENSEDEYIVFSPENEFIYDNPVHRQVAGLPSDYQASGRHISEPPVPSYQSCWGVFAECMQRTLARGQRTKTLDIHPIGYTNEWFCYLYDNSVLLDDSGYHQKGVVHHGRPVMESWQESARALQTLQKIFTGEDQVSMLIDTPKELTNTQAEVLFFLLSRTEPKRIARYMNCSVSTVHNCIDRMRLKLDVTSTAQLLEKAIHMDWHRLIPKRLIGDKQLSIMLD